MLALALVTAAPAPAAPVPAAPAAPAPIPPGRVPVAAVYRWRSVPHGAVREPVATARLGDGPGRFLRLAEEDPDGTRRVIEVRWEAPLAEAPAVTLREVSDPRSPPIRLGFRAASSSLRVRRTPEGLRAARVEPGAEGPDTPAPPAGTWEIELDEAPEPPGYAPAWRAGLAGSPPPLRGG